MSLLKENQRKEGFTEPLSINYVTHNSPIKLAIKMKNTHNLHIKIPT